MFLVYFAFGLAIGSFINCLVYRVNNGLSPIGGRSFCPKCKHQLAWFDNIPLLSFLLLRGKCRYCKKSISWQYPLVELGCAILTIFTYYVSHITYHQSLLITYYLLLITYCLLAIFVSDLIYGTIPDQVVYLGIIISILNLLITNYSLLITNFLSATAAAGFFYSLVLITHGRGMGMGDVKLALLMGLVLGWPKILVALFLAFLTGAIVGVILVLLRKKGLKEAIPFGPFLALSTWITMLI